MPNKLDQIIDISISLSTKAITQQGFGTPLFLGESMKLDRRVKEYADISEVAEDFAESDSEYKMATAAFSQEKVPALIMIGKKVVLASTAITAATNPSGNIVNIELTDIGKNAEVGSTIVVSGFSTSGYNGTALVTAKIDDDNITYTAAGALAATPAAGSGSLVLSETWSNAIQKNFDYNSNWYALAITSNIEADILSAASKIETLDRLFIARSSDVDNLDAAETGSVLHQLNAFNYDRTAFTYNGDTTTTFIDAAWEGRFLPTIPGSENWAHKTLIGIVADDLSSSQSLAVLNKKGNTYEVFAGKSITRWGTVVSGEYIDVIRGADCLKARIQEAVFSVLYNANDKVPMTDIGSDIIENAIRAVFDRAVVDGFIAQDRDGRGLYTVNAPDVIDVPSADRMTRLLSGVTFSGTIAGAINKVGVAGNLSV